MEQIEGDFSNLLSEAVGVQREINEKKGQLEKLKND